MCVDNCQTLNVNSCAVNHVPFVAGQPQKKGSSSNVKQLKYKWRSILDLSSLNKYLKSETFKIETPNI